MQNVKNIFVLWHNPRCSKSRDALRILQENNISPEIREYLKDIPSKKEMFELLFLLKKDKTNVDDVLSIVRQKEKCWKEEDIRLSDLSAVEIIEKLVEFPKAIERPICIKNNEVAVIGRPPENILNLL